MSAPNDLSRTLRMDSRDPHAGFSRAEVAEILDPIRRRGDDLMVWFLAAHFLLGLLFAPLFDTWSLALTMGGIAFLEFLLARWLLPGHFVTRCIAGVSLQIFVALHIYQLHGLPEMHFFFFTAFAMMLVYQDALCMWPGAALIIGQHILFAILHNAGVPLFFFPEPQVGILKLTFHFGIACAHVGLCNAWAVMMRRHTLQQARQHIELKAARDRAESAVQVKSAFLAMMSHEVRTPINAVLGMTQLLREGTLSPAQREMADMAMDGAKALLAIVNDILDFSKLEADRIEIASEPFSLRSLLDRNARLIRPLADDKGLTIEIRLAADAPDQFRGDEGRIGQILLNYLSNAVKFSDRGPITLSAEVDSTLNPAWVTLAVTDCGAGIPADQIHRLFQEFSQVTGGYRPKRPGTGLGLAICKRLAERMGGEVDVRSVLGSGSTFSVRLPLAQTVAPITPEQPPLPAGIRVLVVEDNAINRQLAVRLLQKLECEVDTAPNGAAAIEQWQRGAYDVIFMDCLMDGMDGYEATRRIRAAEANAPGATRTPIIALTGIATDEDRCACLAAGMDDYVAKPFHRADLERALRRSVAQPSEQLASTSSSPA